jgi:hypothetical protein
MPADFARVYPALRITRRKFRPGDSTPPGNHTPLTERIRMTFELQYCEPEEPIERKPICEPVKLLTEHPFKDRRWLIVRKMPEPGFYLLCTTDGLTLAAHETMFSKEA